MPETVYTIFVEDTCLGPKQYTTVKNVCAHKTQLTKKQRMPITQYDGTCMPLVQEG